VSHSATTGWLIFVFSPELAKNLLYLIMTNDDYQSGRTKL